jgi:hypothetical protein
MHRHLGFGILPDVTDTSAAMEITASGRLDIEFPGIRQTGMKDEVTLPLIQPIVDVGRHMPTLEKCVGEDQTAFFIGLHLGHVSIL